MIHHSSIERVEYILVMFSMRYLRVISINWNVPSLICVNKAKTWTNAPNIPINKPAVRSSMTPQDLTVGISIFNYEK